MRNASFAAPTVRPPRRPAPRVVLAAALLLALGGSEARGAAVGGAPGGAPGGPGGVPAAVRAVKPLTAAGAGAQRPRFSPDGTRITYEVGPAGRKDVWVLALAGGAPAPLTEHAADDREPTWTPDGSAVVFASNRDGDYDLWQVPATGGAAVRVTDLPGDEREPAMSPLRYTFSAVYEDPCTGTGVGADVVDRYGKIAFTRDGKRGRAVWFVSDNGAHLERLSPADDVCREPAWSADGRSLAWTCERGGATVVVDTRAVWDQDLSAALRALLGDGSEEDAAGCEEWDPEQWRTDACQKGLPRHYARHEGRALSRVDDALAAPGYSANQTVLLATAPGAGRGVRWRLRSDAGRWQDFPFDGKGALGAVWSPDGSRVVIETVGGGEASLFLADTDFYLQDVRDLVDYPELWGAGASPLLHANGFVARPGTEKEFFVHYEKVNYRARAPFLTTDAALQVFHDEFTTILRRAEDAAAADLLTIAEGALTHYAERLAKGGDATDRWFAVYFAVPAVFLRAGAELKTGPDDEDGWVDPEAPRPPPIGEQLKAAVPAALATVPEAIREDVAALVGKALAHAEVEKVAVPGEREPVLVDWTRFKPRGHYATTGLAGYFVAVSWFGSVPLPVVPETFAFEAWLRSAPAPKDGSDGGETLGARWDTIDALVGAFMGRPADATLTHVRALAAKQPKLLEPFQRAAVVKALGELRGPSPFRGLEGAVEGRDRGIPVLFLPRRYGLDVEFFTRLTHPAVELRGVPSALDVLAALGIERARLHALAREEGAAWAGEYQKRLAELTAETVARPATYWATDLYHGWLALVATLAKPPTVPEQSGLAFARNAAWADRLLYSALAGYTKLKHQAVLYAFQDYSAECDGARPLRLFVEQPILPPPRGFVDPHPAFFGQLAQLAESLYERLNGGEAPTVRDWAGVLQSGTEELQDTVLANAALFARKLEALAQKELRGEALSDDESLWVRGAAPLMEAMFHGQSKPGAAGLTTDEGRTETGVAVVADVHTAIQRESVLEQAVGRLLDLYVVVPDTVGRRLTQGALFSYYEFLQPMSDRLDDLSWSKRLDGTDVPPPPPWTASFLETRKP